MPTPTQHITEIYHKLKPETEQTPLTVQQTVILSLIASGFTWKQIANILFVSVHVVKHQLELLRLQYDAPIIQIICLSVKNNWITFTTEHEN